jgi:hypothetical protein
VGGDGHPHQVGDGEPRAASEALLGQEHLQVPAQLGLQARRQAAVKRLAAEDGAPRFGQRTAAEPAATLGAPQRLTR